MPQNLVIMKMFDAYAITTSGSAESAVVDMRDYIKIESLWVKGYSAAGTPQYTVDWIGGIQTGAFQAYGANDALITNETSENWKILYPPDFKAPYVKFKITAGGSSNADSVFSLYAYVREDYA